MVPAMANPPIHVAALLAGGGSRAEGAGFSEPTAGAWDPHSPAQADLYQCGSSSSVRPRGPTVVCTGPREPRLPDDHGRRARLLGRDDLPNRLPWSSFCVSDLRHATVNGGSREVADCRGCRHLTEYAAQLLKGALLNLMQMSVWLNELPQAASRPTVTARAPRRARCNRASCSPRMDRMRARSLLTSAQSLRRDRPFGPPIHGREIVGQDVSRRRTCAVGERHWRYDR